MRERRTWRDLDTLWLMLPGVILLVLALFVVDSGLLLAVAIAALVAPLAIGLLG